MAAFLRVFNVIMILIYLTAGFYILFNKNILSQVPSYNRYLLGGIILFYGIFRIYTFIRGVKRKRDEEDDS